MVKQDEFKIMFAHPSSSRTIYSLFFMTCSHFAFLMIFQSRLHVGTESVLQRVVRISAVAVEHDRVEQGFPNGLFVDPSKCEESLTSLDHLVSDCWHFIYFRNLNRNRIKSASN